MSKIILQVKNLHKKYQKEIIFSNINFNLKEGDILVLFGKNGIGKSTLLKCISGLIKQSKGSIYTNVDNDKKALVLGEEFLIDSLTIEEYLDFICSIKNVKNREIKKQKILDVLKLTQYKKKLISKLSYGNKSKTSLAIAMIYDPALILLDEPFKGFDILSIEIALNFIKSKSKKSIIIISTHNVEVIKMLEAPHLGVLKNESNFQYISAGNYKEANYNDFLQLLNDEK